MFSVFVSRISSMSLVLDTVQGRKTRVLVLLSTFLCHVFFCYGLRYEPQVTLKPLFIHVQRVTQPF